MGSDEDDLFRREMSGVQPLRREQREAVRSAKKPSDSDMVLARRRLAAVRVDEPDRNVLTLEGMAPLDPWYVLSYQRPGVQNGVFRKLRQGRYEAEASLDLHRMSVARARREIFEFIGECHELGLRSVLIIHGRGQSSAARERCAVLKGCTDHWLRELAVVLAYHSAQVRHGGTGAVYVLLRKSAEKKRENRERFLKGREQEMPPR